jgi:hypothetical protein
MGHYVGVYTDELPTLRSVIGSKSSDHFATVLAASGGQFDHQPEVHDRIATALKGLIAGTFPSGEVQDGHFYVYAFENLCRAFAKKWTIQEIYVDEDQFFEIFNFVWGSVQDDDDFPLLSSDPLHLPKCHVGPVCFHRPLKIVRQEIEILSNLDYDSITETSGTDYRREIAAILEVLRFAARTQQGVFVTFME